MKKRTAKSLMDDDIFGYLDKVYEAKKENTTWWSAMEDAVRQWNKDHKTRKEPTKAVSDYLHRKAQL